jgi:beta-aspartyl-peptidase (threonine type)
MCRHCFVVSLWVVAAVSFLGWKESEARADPPRWAIALHGGAGSISRDISPERLSEYKQSLREALETGERILREGGTALDAVEQTVIVLENAPCFNAGRGAVFNIDGFHQLDASIMDGSNLKGGGVAAVESIRNPIRAARLVMEKTPHLILSGQYADAIAREYGLEMVSQTYYFDGLRWDQLNQARAKQGLPELKQPAYGFPQTGRTLDSSDNDFSTGTVGCVALDQHGHLAAATSTGGLTGKMTGRIGDSPILGAGNYADDLGCAASGTGTGEEFIRNAITFQVSFRVRHGGQTLDEAVRECVDQVLKPGQGGVIAVDRKGNLSLRTNTTSMNRAWADSTGKRGIAIWDEPLE